MNTKENELANALIGAEGRDGRKLRLLLATHADVNSKNGYGTTALVAAAQPGNIKGVEALIAAPRRR